MSKSKDLDYLMSVIDRVSDKVNKYEKRPHNYGSGDFLYVVEVHTLDLIGSNIEITSSEIARRTFKTKGAVSQIIDKLIKKKLIKQRKSEVDARKNIFELTKKGLEVYLTHLEVDKIAHNRYLERLQDQGYSDSDFKKCSAILNIIFKLEH
ncbi:MAG: MarR family transcriptional regulator [Erysipelotrichaceae bacterium]